MRTITPQIRPSSPLLPQPVIAAPVPMELHIEAVVMHGFSRSEAQRAAASLQHELARLLGDGGLRAGSPASAPRRDGGSIAIVAGRPELTGIRAARAIHGELRR
jgi:hypothetical protein